MSTFGGFGGFGGNNQQQQSSGFGTPSGFGTTTGTGGFGQQASTGFGATNTNTNPGGSLFGGSTGGFGTTGGGFGSAPQQGTSIFGGGGAGNKFGQATATTGGGLFGNTTTTSAPTFGGFGGTTTTSGFGGSAQGTNNLFGGGSKPGFGGTTTGGNLFGAGGFGTTTPATNAFGAPSSTALSQPVPPSEGSAKVPFQAHTDKDTPTSTVVNHFQSISFMPAYEKYSPEELRLADYTAGRKYGNASNQPGAFGTSSGFGAFGQATGSTGFGGGGGGLFAAANTATATTNPFGAAQTTTTGFGTSGNLFGAKPATSAPLFGGGTTTTTSGGGMFGGTGFGSSGGTGLFGGGGGGTQKPGGLFGQTSSSPFGQATAATSSNPFGTTPSFGTAQQQNTGANLFGGFGQPAQQQQNQGGSAFGGGFGQQPQSTGSLFGAPKTTAPASTSLFGTAQPQAGGLFGTQPNQTGTSLFGTQPQQEQKPGLFGQPFGGTQTQSTSLFGANTQQQPKPGLFGSAQSGGLFGNPANTASQPSLFGGSNQTQQLQGSTLLGSGNSSMFGNSQNVLQQQQPGSLHADLLGNNVYGSASIFSGLPQPSSVPSGPVATPLKTPTQTKRQVPLPYYKINPAAANRLLVPQKKGFGLSPSPYGSPSSPGSSPNGSIYGGSLLGGSLGRSLGRATSLTNLRRTFDRDHESIITPGAFSASSSRFSNGSAKRLNIDRSLGAADIFASPKASPTLPSTEAEVSGPPNKLKKRVSFDSALGKDRTTEMSGALVRTETNGAEPTAEELGFLRSRRGRDTNGVANGTARQPEMEQVRGNELAIVPEDGETQPSPSAVVPSPPANNNKRGDYAPGEYWCKPSLSELRKMSQVELKHVPDFEVGRQSCGFIHFDQPVDLTSIKLDELLGTVVEIRVRSMTVYRQNATTPPRGTGLNVPSTITMEQSWPRSKSHSSGFDKSSAALTRHLVLLKRTENTHFVDYNPTTGIWVFKVDHYTTYEMYDDDDVDAEGESFNQSTLSAPPDTPTPKSRTMTLHPTEDLTEEMASEESELEDTYEFKKKIVPGSFGNEAEYEEYESIGENNENQPFFEDGSVDSTSNEHGQLEEELESDEEMDMAGSFPKPDSAAEQENVRAPVFGSPLGSIFKQPQQPLWTPGKVQISLDSSWAQQLQRTVSPKKQDREALREVQGRALIDRDSAAQSPAKAPAKEKQTAKGFRNSIDLMSSLFGKHEEQRLGKKQRAEGKGFEWPYPKKAKSFAGDGSEMSEADVAYHKSFRANFGPRGELLFIRPAEYGLESGLVLEDGVLTETVLAEVHGVPVVAASLTPVPDDLDDHLRLEKMQTNVSVEDGIPFATMRRTEFQAFANLTPPHATSKKAVRERQVWQLAHILFDEYEDDISAAVPRSLRKKFDDRIKKDRLSRYWRALVGAKAAKDLAGNPSDEERAVIHLSAGNVRAACASLLKAKDFHLAALIAQMGGDRVLQEGMRDQIREWHESNMTSEMTDPIRALYELLAGNACHVEGVKGRLEDRASDFVISERFGLDWTQAFALRLWCSILEEEPLENAVNRFENDIMTSLDPVWPSPWFVDESHELDASDPKSEWRVSPLWTLLQLYASSRLGANKEPIDLLSSIMPQSTIGEVSNMRLTFQLYHALVARRNIKFRTSSALSDQLSINFASELSSVGQYIYAALALLHLTDAEDRERTVKELLARHAPEIPDVVGPAADVTAETVWHVLTEELGIPGAWIWEARALNARSLRYTDENAVKAEVRYLLEAENYDQAHKVFCRTVAPRAIIERDYAQLEALLEGFAAQPEHQVKDWSQGGALYLDFVKVALDRVEPTSADGRHGRATVLKKLVKVLPEVAAKGNLAFEESVAIKEMAALVVDWVNEEAEAINAVVTDPENILRLPLTEDQRIRRTWEVGVGYYEGVMAQGR